MNPEKTQTPSPSEDSADLPKAERKPQRRGKTAKEADARKRTPYSEKLRDPRWQKMRLQIMERDGFACRHCSSKTKTLNVHHCFYDKGNSPWEYADRVLVTLCEDCHKHEEARKRSIALSTGNDPLISVYLANAIDALDGLGPFSHPVFGFLLRNSIEVCRAYESLITARDEPVDLEELEKLDQGLVDISMKVIGALMEIRCQSNSVLESKMMEGSF